MKRGSWNTCLFIVTVAIGASCVEPYPPPVTDANANYLVVNGFLNSTDGRVDVRITRTIPLSATTRPPVVTGASVTVEEENGSSITVREMGEGDYAIEGLPIDPSRRYRLRVVTPAGETCVSDYITLKATPPIDSVTWDTTPDGIRILVNAHDDTGQTIYYKWDFIETWEYHATYYSSLKFADNISPDIVVRSEDELIYTCWRSARSNPVLISSSERLSQDVVSKFPITHIEKGNQRLLIRYSILVKQYALTRDVYDYWKALKETTEGLGGLFDPQPGQVLGNFRNESDSDNPVVGYFSGGQVQQKRFFLSSNQLPPAYQFSPTNWNCVLDTVLVDEIGAFSREANLLVSSVYQGPVLLGYTSATIPCADCRTQGGSTSKPSFWE